MPDHSHDAARPVPPSYLFALRERVAAKGGFPTLLAAIDLMLLHFEPGYEHERHPLVRSYRVASHAWAVMTQAFDALPEDEQSQAAYGPLIGRELAERAWRRLQRERPNLAERVMAGPNSYKESGVTPITELRERPALAAAMSPPAKAQPAVRLPPPTPGYRNKVTRRSLASQQMHQAATALAEATDRFQQRPTLCHHLEARIAREAADQAARHVALCQRSASDGA